MSWLKEKLVALRSQEIKEAEETGEAERAWAEKKERALKKEIEKTWKLIEIANKQLRPTLELVNEVYLENEGVVLNTSAVNDTSPPYFGCMSNAYLESEGKVDPSSFPSSFGRLEDFERYFSSSDVFLGLDWGRWSGAYSYGGNLLNISLNRAQRVELTGTKESPRIELGLNDRNFQQKLEKGIYKILTTPDACSWYRERPDRDR